MFDGHMRTRALRRVFTHKAPSSANALRSKRDRASASVPVSRTEANLSGSSQDENRQFQN